MPCHTRMKTLFLQGLLWLYLLEIGFTVTSLEPGYLDFDNLPDTNFSCVGKVIGGYYADLETSCQMFHVCTIGQLDEPMDIRFLCLNGTVFDQETRVCERIDEVDCTKSEQFYSLNLELYGNTQPPILEESPETDPPIVIKPPSTTTTTTTTSTTTQQPPKVKTSRPSFYTTPRHPTVTTTHTPPTPKVISTHHFPVGHPADIRFNPAEINISLHPGQAPIIRPKPLSYQQQSFSGNSEKNKRVIVTTHTTIYENKNKNRVPLNQNHDQTSLESPKIVQHEQINLSTEKIVQQSTTKPRPVVNYGHQHNNNPSSTPSDINYGFNYDEDDGDVDYNTKTPVHHNSYQFERVPDFREVSSSEAVSDFESNKNEQLFKSSTYRTIFHPTTKLPHLNTHRSPTTYRSHTLFSSSLKPLQPFLYHRSEKPNRLQLPLPHLPTIPPLTFSSPAPFTLNRHVETKRFADHHAPRIVISASASVSDASGRRLNYSLGTIETSEFFDPSSYEDYKEDEVGLEQFYADVPKIQKSRERRQTNRAKVLQKTYLHKVRQLRKLKRRKRDVVKPEDVIKSEQEAIDILKFLYEWYEQHEKQKTSTSLEPNSQQNSPTAAAGYDEISHRNKPIETSISVITDINEHTTKISIPVSPQVITDINNELSANKNLPPSAITEDIFKELTNEDKPVNWQSTKKYALKDLKDEHKEKLVNEAMTKSNLDYELQEAIKDDLKRASTLVVDTANAAAEDKPETNKQNVGTRRKVNHKPRKSHNNHKIDNNNYYTNIDVISTVEEATNRQSSRRKGRGRKTYQSSLAGADKKDVPTETSPKYHEEVLKESIRNSEKLDTSSNAEKIESDTSDQTLSSSARAVQGFYITRGVATIIPPTVANIPVSSSKESDFEHEKNYRVNSDSEPIDKSVTNNEKYDETTTVSNDQQLTTEQTTDKPSNNSSNQSENNLTSTINVFDYVDDNYEAVKLDLQDQNPNDSRDEFQKHKVDTPAAILDQTININDYVDDNYEPQIYSSTSTVDSTNFDKFVNTHSNNEHTTETNKVNITENTTIDELFNIQTQNSNETSTSETTENVEILKNETNVEVNGKTHPNRYLIAILTEDNSDVQTSTTQSPQTTLQQFQITNSVEEVDVEKNSTQTSDTTIDLFTETLKSILDFTTESKYTEPQSNSDYSQITESTEAVFERSTSPQIVHSRRGGRRKSKENAQSYNKRKGKEFDVEQEEHEKKHSTKVRTRGRVRAKYTLPAEYNDLTKTPKKSTSSLFQDRTINTPSTEDFILPSSTEHVQKPLNTLDITSTDLPTKYILQSETNEPVDTSSVFQDNSTNTHKIEDLAAATTLESKENVTSFEDVILTDVQQTISTAGQPNIPTTLGDLQLELQAPYLDSIDYIFRGDHSTEGSDTVEKTSVQDTTTFSPTSVEDVEVPNTTQQLVESTTLPTTERISDDSWQIPPEFTIKDDISTTAIPLKMEKLQTLIENIEMSTKSVAAVKVPIYTTIKVPEISGSSFDYTTSNIATTQTPTYSTAETTSETLTSTERFSKDNFHEKIETTEFTTKPPTYQSESLTTKPNLKSIYENSDRTSTERFSKDNFHEKIETTEFTTKPPTYQTESLTTTPNLKSIYENSDIFELPSSTKSHNSKIHEDDIVIFPESTSESSTANVATTHSQDIETRKTIKSSSTDSYDAVNSYLENAQFYLQNFLRRTDNNSREDPKAEQEPPNVKIDESNNEPVTPRQRGSRRRNDENLRKRQSGHRFAYQSTSRNPSPRRRRPIKENISTSTTDEAPTTISSTEPQIIYTEPYETTKNLELIHNETDVTETPSDYDITTNIATTLQDTTTIVSDTTTFQEITSTMSIEQLSETITNKTNSSISEKLINDLTTHFNLTNTLKNETDEVALTDAPIAKSANPTAAKKPTKKVHTTTPISRLFRIELRKEVVDKNYVFNCFDKPLNHYYSDPRDCRLFHYCTSGYTKNQLLDMKFVCDFGTYFDDEKFVCTKIKPSRCR